MINNLISSGSSFKFNQCSLSFYGSSTYSHYVYLMWLNIDGEISSNSFYCLDSNWDAVVCTITNLAAPGWIYSGLDNNGRGGSGLDGLKIISGDAQILKAVTYKSGSSYYDTVIIGKL